jgi:hypothetical protein
MPSVSVTTYELDHDLLPPVCARCGAPAPDRVVQKLYILDGWSGAALVFGLLFGLFFFPPLILVVVRYAQSASVRLPLCPPHRDTFLARSAWGERILFPVWTAAALVADGLMIVDFVTWGPGGPGLCFAPIAVLLAGTFGSLFAFRGRVGIERPDPTGLRLTGVSEAFVTALADDRARDRVNNPDRRGGRGDVRDDYDDEVV